MFSVSPEIYDVLSTASRWIFAFFALLLLFFALSWHRSDRKERKDRFKKLPGAGTIGELVVLSGNEELPTDTWFPVPREGVLGSLRSCDLVVPCSGVRSQHLDFSWQDGSGLLIRPRFGCEALVDGVPVTRSAGEKSVPMVHGSVLQVGGAVMRLQLFSALSHTNRTFVPAAPVSEPGLGSWVPSGQPPVSCPPAAAQRFPQQPQGQPYFPEQPFPQPPVYPQQITDQPAVPQQRTDLPLNPLPPQDPAGTPSQSDEQLPQNTAGPRRRRVSQWKEDWGE